MTAMSVAINGVSTEVLDLSYSIPLRVTVDGQGSVSFGMHGGETTLYMRCKGESELNSRLTVTRHRSLILMVTVGVEADKTFIITANSESGPGTRQIGYIDDPVNQLRTRFV